MNWKFWKKVEEPIKKAKEAIIRSKGYEYPCKGCLALPGQCYQLCDKVERDENKLRAAGDLANKNQDHLTCPDCGGQSWYDGPCGGMSQNIKCGTCGHWFNFAGPLGFTERIHVGENGRIYD